MVFPLEPERPISRRDLLRTTLSAGAALAVLPLLACGGDRPEDSVETQPAGPGASPGPVGISPAGWSQLQAGGTSPSPRRDHVLAYDAAEGSLYLHGGRSAGQPLSDLWLYETGAGTWRPLSPSGEGPAPRFGHNAAFDAPRGRLVLFGGQAGTSFFNDLWAYEVASNRWRRLGEGGPARRYGAGGALDPDSATFFLSHGFTFQGRFDDTWALPLTDTQWKELSPAQGRPLKRCLLRSVWEPDTRSILLFGGQSDSAPYHNDFWRFDTASREWREIQADPRPGARHFYAAAYDTAASRLLLFGGSTAGGSVDDLWAFGTGSGAWSKLEMPGGPAARNGHDAVYLPDRRSLIVFGGAGTEDELGDLWELGLS